MTNEMKVRIVLRHDTTRGWKAVGDTTVLLQGEEEFNRLSKNVLITSQEAINLVD